MQVTRDVDPQDVADLGTDPPRACLAVIRAGRIRLLPVRAAAVEDGYRVIVRHEDAVGLDNAQALLVIDDGVAWFELRALTVRGALATSTAPSNAGRLPEPGLPKSEHPEPETAGPPAIETLPVPEAVTFLLIPRRVIAWDYGALRPSAHPEPAAEGRATG